MNCQEFTSRVDEMALAHLSLAAPDGSLVRHAATCERCDARLETERALTVGLHTLASDERSIEAPASLRKDLLAAFGESAQEKRSSVVMFPRRSNWSRLVLAAAAAIVLGFVMFAARVIQHPTTNKTAEIIAGPSAGEKKAVEPNIVAVSPPQNIVERPVMSGEQQKHDRARRQRKDIAVSSRFISKSTRGLDMTMPEGTETEVASTEVKSQFVPLTYLNEATAMESGIVVRVEVAREKLASLGLPFDLERADEIIKADIILGDDGVARAIRLVQ